MTFVEDLKKEGYSEGNVGAVQTFFLRSDTERWTEDRLSALAPLDAVIHLSRERARAKIYPAVAVGLMEKAGGLFLLGFASIAFFQIW